MKSTHLLVAVAATIVLAGCSSTGTAPTPTPPPPPGGGDPVLDSPQAALSSYVDGGATVYTSGADIGSELASATGVSGFGITTRGGATGTAAASGSGLAYTLGNARLTDGGDRLVIEVGGTEYSLAHNRTLWGGQERYYGNSPFNPAGGDGGIVLAPVAMDGESYVSLLLHLENPQWTTVNGNSYYITEVDGYSALVAGLLTPETNLPTAVARYEGGLLVATNAADYFYGEAGRFLVNVDFDSGEIRGFANYFEDSPDFVGTRIEGQLNGDNRSTFTGGLTAVASDGMNGEFLGGFFGPNAAQVAGTATGTITDGGMTHEVGAAFFGGKTNP